MKLNEQQVDSVSNLEGGSSLTFKSEAYIFSMFRDKIYSDPIRSIVREVICNARDASRKANTTKPIQIELTDTLFKVTDYGTGISPETMKNVVMVYGESTKRDSNLETGGFGLGFKSPFAHTSQFCVITTYEGTTYTYLLSIDTSGKGMYTCISTEPGTENGTTIEIPINNRHGFKQALEYYLPYITYPIENNLNIKPNPPICRGTKWAIYQDCTDIFADEIRYPQHDYRYARYSSVFENGEVDFSASRENIRETLSYNKLMDQIRLNFEKEHIDKINEISNSVSLKEFAKFLQYGQVSYRGIPIESYPYYYKGYKNGRWRKGFNLDYQIIWEPVSEYLAASYSRRIGTSVQILPVVFKPYITGKTAEEIKAEIRRPRKAKPTDHIHVSDFYGNKEWITVEDLNQYQYYCLKNEYPSSLGQRVVIVNKTDVKYVDLPHFSKYVNPQIKGLSDVSYTDYTTYAYLKDVLPEIQTEIDKGRWCNLHSHLFSIAKINVEVKPHNLLERFPLLKVIRPYSIEEFELVKQYISDQIQLGR